MEDPGIDRRIILKWILEKRDVDADWIDLSLAGSCEGGNELSGFITCGKFLHWLRTCWLLRKDSAPWS
jgi:hypothetical protein